LQAPQEVRRTNDVPKTNKRERQEVVTHNARPQKIVRRQEEEVTGIDFDASGSGHQWVSEEDSEETEEDDDSEDDEETEDED
jgi:hypothetical protein